MDPEIRQVKTFTLKEPTANPLERFMGRVLRGEVLESLSQYPLPENRNWDFLVFGSSVVQLNRPDEGYPFRRRARDIDLTIKQRGSGNTTMLNLSKDDLQEATTYLLAGIALSGAALTEGSINDVRLNQGFRIQRYFSSDAILQRLRGKVEEQQFCSLVDLNVELEVEPFVQRSHILPLTQYGHLQVENILEVVGQKVARSLHPNEFVLRDLVDIYNVYRSGVVDVMAERETLRVVALVWLGMKELHLQFNKAHLWPSDDVIRDYSETLGVPQDIVKEILEVNRAIQEIVFPGEPSNHLRLLLRQNEEDFLYLLNGISRGEQSHERHLVQPQINPGYLQKSNPTPFKKYPEISSNICRDLELRKRVQDAINESNLREF